MDKPKTETNKKPKNRLYAAYKRPTSVLKTDLAECEEMENDIPCKQKAKGCRGHIIRQNEFQATSSNKRQRKYEKEM